MKRTPKRQKTIVGILTDAQPTFVSLVERGANQRPFHAIKSHDKESAMKHRAPALKAAAAAAVALTRISFDKATFETEQDVSDFLIAKGYEDFKVEDGGTAFYVEGESADEVEGETREVQSHKDVGVTYTLGNRKKSDDTPADDAAGTEAGTEGTGGPAATDAPAATESTAEAGDAEEGDDADAKPDDDAGTEGVGEADAGAPGAQDTPADPEAAQAQNNPEGKPAGEEVPAPVATDPAPAVVETTPEGVRKRARPGSLRIGGMSVAALVAKAEEAVEAAPAEHTAKAMSDYLQSNMYSLPGLYSVQEALSDELAAMIRGRRFSTENVNVALADFNRAVSALVGAVETILYGSTDTTVAKGAAAPEVDDATLEAAVAAILGKPKEGEPMADAPMTAKQADAILAGLAEVKDRLDRSDAKADTVSKSMVALFDSAVVDAIEEEADEDAQPRVIPGRKSAQAPEVETETKVEEQEADDAEAKEAQVRTAKRLGWA